MPLILEDSSSQLWLITVDDSGILHSATTGSGSPTTLILNDPSNAASWEVGITTAGLLMTTSVSVGSYPQQYALTSTTGESTWNIQVTHAGILETDSILAALPPIMSSIANGLFDAATVEVVTIYWGIGETPATGIARGSITTFVGQVTKVNDIGRDKADLEVADMLYQLNLLTPPNLIQSSCRHELFDEGCTLLKTNFQLANSVLSANNLIINLNASVTTAPWWNGVITFTQGFIKWTSGKNTGLTGYIKSLNSNTQILLANPMPFPIVAGDQFTMYAGCNKTISMCQNGFANLLNHGGMEFVPNPEVGI
jgi:uncharacterized phage protein (TIGR02218 family)